MGLRGRTETVLQNAAGSNYTYNIWGLDNIGQVKVNSTQTRYFQGCHEPFHDRS